MARLLSICGFCCLLLLASCSHETRVTGFPFNAYRMSELAPEKSTKEDLRRVLGSPSHIPPFHPQRWYYVYREVEQVAFLDPETTKQTVLAFDFDSNDKIKDVFLYTKGDRANFNMVARITPSRGETLSFLDQLLSSGARLPGGIQGTTPR